MKKIPIRNKSGVKGVFWVRSRSRWTARIGLGGKIKNLGYFLTIAEATCAYAKAQQVLHGKFARVAS